MKFKASSPGFNAVKCHGEVYIGRFCDWIIVPTVAVTPSKMFWEEHHRTWQNQKGHIAMTYRDESNHQSKSEFMSVGKAVESVTGRRINPSTIWRWIRQGVAGIAGERIRLEYWPMGRSVLTTEQAVRDFIEKQKQAKAKRGLQLDATIEELERHGLLPKKFPSQDSGKKSRDAWRRE